MSTLYTNIGLLGFVHTLFTQEQTIRLNLKTQWKDWQGQASDIKQGCQRRRRRTCRGFLKLPSRRMNAKLNWFIDSINKLLNKFSKFFTESETICKGNLFHYSRLCTVYWYAQSILTLSMGSVLWQEFGDFSKCIFYFDGILAWNKILLCSESFLLAVNV